MKKKIKKDKRKIPKGYYCYKNIEEYFERGDLKYRYVGVCPYWSKRKGYAKQECGYCAYLGKGDYELNREIKYTKVYTKNGKEIRGKPQTAVEIGFCMSTIWDMVKMCGIKEG